MLKKTPLLACLVFLGLCAPAAWARVQDAVVGADGEIYVAQKGAYDALFPKTSPAEATGEVLALDIIRPDSPLERQLVPGTQAATVESNPTLVYEDDSRTVFLVWENEVDEVHSVLMLAAFNGNTWTGPFELTDRRRFSPAAAPQIAITRDSYRDKEADGSPKTRHRTVLHVLWEEEVLANEYATFYTPVILEEGSYLKGNPLYNLNELIPAGATPATSFDTALALVQSPSIQHGAIQRSVVAAFASAAARRVFTVEIDVLPEELGRLAGKTRSVIFDLGAKLYPGNLRALADQTKAYILAQETAFQPEILEAIAERVHSQILSSNNNPGLTAVADNTGAVIIDLGARLTGRGLRSGGAGAKLAEIPRDSSGLLTPHLLQFRVTSGRSAPRVGSAELKIFTSANGEDVLIAWTEGDVVRYRESTQANWTEPRETKLSGDITKERAYKILEQRIRNR